MLGVGVVMMLFQKLTKLFLFSIDSGTYLRNSEATDLELDMESVRDWSWGRGQYALLVCV